MWRRGLAALTVAVLAAMAAAPSAHAAEIQRAWVSTKWTVEGISADQRTLRVRFPAGGCIDTLGRAFAREGPHSIGLQVDSYGVVSLPEGYGCTLELRAGIADVTLARPLAGRKIVGATPNVWGSPIMDPFISRGMRIIRLVPRLRGFRADDALEYLRARGLAARPVPAALRGREVITTRPRVWTELPERPEPIRLVLRRPRR